MFVLHNYYMSPNALQLWVRAVQIVVIFNAENKLRAIPGVLLEFCGFNFAVFFSECFLSVNIPVFNVGPSNSYDRSESPAFLVYSPGLLMYIITSMAKITARKTLTKVCAAENRCVEKRRYFVSNLKCKFFLLICFFFVSFLNCWI